MRSIVEDIMYDRAEGLFAASLGIALGMLSSVYGFCVSTRNFLYDKNIFKSHEMPVRVVSIGNVSVGGTGKTPATIMTASMLREAGFDVAVVSRGYGGTANEAVVASDGAGSVASPVIVGDEPHIIAGRLPDIPVVVGRDRVKAVELAIRKFRPRIVVLDDGFQHRRLHRNVDVVTVDACSLFGNERLLPRGVLREAPYALKRAGAVLITRGDMNDRGRVERMIRYYSRTIPIFWSRQTALGVRKAGDTVLKPAVTLEGTSVCALSNVASPGRFHDQLESIGADVVLKKTMPDHYRYTAEDIRSITRDATAAGADAIVMTAKDERNLPDDAAFETVEPFVLDVTTELIEKPEEFLDLITPHFSK